MTIGVPVKLLHEAEGHVITVELKSGELYRGHLIDAEDNMNCHLQQVDVTHRDGRKQQMASAFIRGSKVRYILVPDMLKNAAMFKRLAGEKVAGVGLVKKPSGGGGRGRGGGGGRGRGGPPRR